MLMNVTSGLTALEVKQKRNATGRAAKPLIAQFQLRPLLLLGIGLGLLTDVWFDTVWVGLGVAVVIALLAVTLHLLFAHWLKQFDSVREVLVIRDGLARVVAVDELVAGDCLEVVAGTIVPVDVRTTVTATPTGWLRVVMALTGITQTQNTAFAGSVLAQDARVTVAATGDSRFVVSAAMQFLAHAQRFSLMALVRGLRGVFAASAQWVRGVARLGVMELRAAQARWASRTASGRRSIGVILTPWLDHMTLVGTLRQHSKEAAFRYNQDPVSWRPA